MPTLRSSISAAVRRHWPRHWWTGALPTLPSSTSRPRPSTVPVPVYNVATASVGSPIPALARPGRLPLPGRSGRPGHLSFGSTQSHCAGRCRRGRHVRRGRPDDMLGPARPALLGRRTHRRTRTRAQPDRRRSLRPHDTPRRRAAPHLGRASRRSGSSLLIESLDGTGAAEPRVDTVRGPMRCGTARIDIDSANRVAGSADAATEEPRCRTNHHNTLAAPTNTTLRSGMSFNTQWAGLASTAWLTGPAPDGRNGQPQAAYAICPSERTARASERRRGHWRLPSSRGLSMLVDLRRTGPRRHRLCKLGPRP
jgi:hypothetical protein